MLNSSMLCRPWDFHVWPPQPVYRQTGLLYLFIYLFLNARPECHCSSDPLPSLQDPRRQESGRVLGIPLLSYSREALRRLAAGS